MMIIISWILTIANTVILLGGIVRLIKVYWNGKSSIKDTRKEFIHLIFIMIIIGMVPGLPSLSVHTGEAIMKPLTAIVDYATENVTDSVNQSTKGQ